MKNEVKKNHEKNEVGFVYFLRASQTDPPSRRFIIIIIKRHDRVGTFVTARKSVHSTYYPETRRHLEILQDTVYYTCVTDPSLESWRLNRNKFTAIPRPFDVHENNISWSIGSLIFRCVYGRRTWILHGTYMGFIRIDRYHLLDCPPFRTSVPWKRVLRTAR